MDEAKKYLIQENKIIFDGSKLSFDFPIQESIEIGNMLIVYINLKDKVIPLEENVFGVSISEEELKWQIEKRKYPTRHNPKMLCYFIDISFHDNKLRLFNWCDTAFIVEPSTGKILDEYQTR